MKTEINTARFEEKARHLPLTPAAMDSFNAEIQAAILLTEHTSQKTALLLAQIKLETNRCFYQRRHGDQ